MYITNNNNNKMTFVTHQFPTNETVQGTGVVINCMGKGKEGSRTYMYIVNYTQLEGGEKTMISTDTFYVLSQMDS